VIRNWQCGYDTRKVGELILLLKILLYCMTHCLLDVLHAEHLAACLQAGCDKMFSYPWCPWHLKTFNWPLVVQLQQPVQCVLHSDSCFSQPSALYINFISSSCSSSSVCTDKISNQMICDLYVYLAYDTIQYSRFMCTQKLTKWPA